jgi:hypothetical protein
MHLDAQRLKDLAEAARGLRGCAACAPLQAPGWESVPAGSDTRLLQPLGTLRAPAANADAPAEEPTWQEHHPHGTRTDSPDAPIAPAFHPYNRSELHACKACGKLFLRYTEGGGYYVDARVRELNPDLIAP